MDVVELGGIRLHILRVHPGLPHEGDRVFRELVKLAPAVILGDLDTDDALRLRAALAEKTAFEPSAADATFAEATRARFGGENTPGEHPLQAAARFARDRRSEFIPMRAIAPRPGFFARRRMRKAAERVDAATPEAFAAAFERAMGKDWSAADEVDGAQRRMMRALNEGRAPIVAVVQAHRASAFLERARATGRIPA